MEMHKYKKEQTLVAKGLIIILSLILFTSCFFEKEEDKNAHDIEVFKSENGTYRYITMKSFHYDNKEKSPASYRVNNIILSNELSYEKIINVLEGEFKIESLFPGKTTNTIKLTVKKGDSIVVKFYLKDSDETSEHYNKK